MGKSCIRFKRVEDLALDLIAGSVGSMSVEEFIDFYERSILSRNKQAAAKRTARGAASKAPAKKAKASSPRRAGTKRARG
jgi:hypothetical protein